MARNFAEIAYSPAVKEMQEKMGSRPSYARMEQATFADGLTGNEEAFIAERDSFYMASTGDSGYPYIQHRGGPKGFLKVLDSKHIAFIDFKGNMQYISVGNLATNNKVALIMVDYPAKARLKVYATATIVDLKDGPGLFARLDLGDYKFKPERMMVLEIEAYDWNCPQYITPRYTLEEIDAAMTPQRNQVAILENEVKRLKAKLKEAGLQG